MFRIDDKYFLSSCKKSEWKATRLYKSWCEIYLLHVVRDGIQLRNLLNSLIHSSLLVRTLCLAWTEWLGLVSTHFPVNGFLNLSPIWFARYSTRMDKYLKYHQRACKSRLWKMIDFNQFNSIYSNNLQDATQQYMN